MKNFRRIKSLPNNLNNMSTEIDECTAKEQFKINTSGIKSFKLN